VSTFRLTGRRGGRTAARALVIAAAVTTVAPLAATATATASSGSGHSLRGVVTHRQVDKAAVLKALFATKDRQSVLGTYGFNSNGDTTLKSYGLYKVGSDGEPVFFKTLTPTKTVS